MERRIDFPDPIVGEPGKPRLEMETALPPAPEFHGGPDARKPIGAGYTPGQQFRPPSIVEQFHLLDYLRVLTKQRAIAFTAFIVTFGSAILYALTATPQYSAKTQLLIENQEANVVAFKEVVEENRQTDYYQTQYRILQSRALAKRTLDSEKLWDDPVFVADINPGKLAESWQWARTTVTGSPQEPVGADENAVQSKIIDAYLRRIRVAPVRNSRLVDLYVETPDAGLSARLGNAHAREYIEQNLEFKFLASKEASTWLEARMSEQRQRVSQSEQALQKYREQTGAVALEDRENIVVQRLADLNAAVTRARTDRIEKEAQYNQIRSIQVDRAALDTFPAILSSSFIQQLKAQLSELQRQQAQLADKLGERHPDMVKLRTAIEATEARISSEVQKIVQALRNDYLASLANERALQSSLDQQRGEAQDLNRASIQYGALQRDAVSNRELFQGLMQRTRETDIASDLRTNNIRVVDHAETPRTPSKPNRRNTIFIGLFGGLFLAAALAFFFEYLDNHIRTPEEIKSYLGLPFLGLVPIVARDKGADIQQLLLSADVPHGFSEAFRAIRTNVIFSSADEGTKTIVITSTGPNEGKTTVSANLAIALAQTGMRTLIIDCDMRRPQLHQMFRLKQEPGLSNVMVGTAKASEVVKKSTVTANLWALPAGKLPPNPAELLGSARFREFVRSLEEHFDWILLDSPPVMAVTDASILSHNANGVLFVVGCEMTARGAAKTALDQLQSSQAKFVGCVLNRVNLDRFGYYYANYYRRAYADYYASKDSN